MGEKLHDIGLDNYSFDMTSKVQETKEKIDKWNYIKLISFYTVKESTE